MLSEGTTNQRCSKGAFSHLALRLVLHNVATAVDIAEILPDDDEESDLVWRDTVMELEVIARQCGQLSDELCFRRDGEGIWGVWADWEYEV